MSYKSILTVLTRAADAALAVGAAARLAQTLDAPFDVLVFRCLFYPVYPAVEFNPWSDVSSAFLL